MNQRAEPTTLHHVDWPATFPFLRLFRAFGMALQPGSLLLALALVALLYLAGLTLDAIWAEPNDAPAHAQPVATGEPFAMTLDGFAQGFSQLIGSAVALDLGVADYLAQRDATRTGGVLGALLFLLSLPVWLFQVHPWFVVIYGLFALLLTALFGGAIARRAALQATRHQSIGPVQALRFAVLRYPWFALSPIMPIALSLLLLLLVAIGGLLFNAPVLDIIAGIGFGLMLIAGLLVALLLLGLASAGHLFTPAMAVEGTDSFDVISRAFNYVFGRPWRYLFYTLLTLIYAALTYLLVLLVVYVALALTRTAAGLWVFREADDGLNRFEAISPTPQPDAWLTPVPWEALGPSGSVAAFVVMLWTMLLVALLPAFLVSFYFTAHTWIYLLLRRVADGTDFDDVYLEADDDEQPDGPDDQPAQADTTPDAEQQADAPDASDASDAERADRDDD